MLTHTCRKDAEIRTNLERLMVPPSFPSIFPPPILPSGNFFCVCTGDTRQIRRLGLGIAIRWLGLQEALTAQCQELPGLICPHLRTMSKSNPQHGQRWWAVMPGQKVIPKSALKTQSGVSLKTSVPPFALYSLQTLQGTSAGWAPVGCQGRVGC